jgi:hypothetical protein
MSTELKVTVRSSATENLAGMPEKLPDHRFWLDADDRISGRTCRDSRTRCPSQQPLVRRRYVRVRPNTADAAIEVPAHGDLLVAPRMCRRRQPAPGTSQQRSPRERSSSVHKRGPSGSSRQAPTRGMPRPGTPSG